MKTSITRNKIIIYAAVAVFWLAVWQGISMLIGEEILFVSPFSVVKEILHMFKTTEYWFTLLFSVIRVLAGFVAGYVFATALAIISFRFKLVETFFSPIISVIKSTPVASFIILALVWIGNSTVPTFICMLMVIPIVWSNVISGLKSVDVRLIEMTNIYRFSFLKKLKYLYFPSLIPYFSSASGSGLGLCWKAGIAAEVICRTKMSIGNNIWETKYYLETRQMFAWTVSVIIMSVIFDRLIKYIHEKMTGRFGEKV